MSETKGLASSLFSLTKPRVVVLLQITAMCAILSHDMIKLKEINIQTFENMFFVFVGGYLTAGGANCINMWYDRDIDPIMKRTSERPIPNGDVSPEIALIYGIMISIIGTFWLLRTTNEVAAFWALFSILFYVIIYTMWLKRSTVQNIVIGGIAGSTPPVIGWCASEGDLQISTNSLQEFANSIFDIGGYMPWFMFLMIFLWTPPHFWALALYRSKEYEKVGVPMLPNIKGKQRTLVEMKIYSIILVLLSLTAPLNYSKINTFNEIDLNDLLIVLNTMILSIWYALTVWKIDVTEDNDENDRMPTASHSFFVSLSYLAIMFVILVLSSIGFKGSIMSLILILFLILKMSPKKV
jgi:protoheme IX farnesyltransferase